jgi:hypothetical protein
MLTMGCIQPPVHRLSFSKKLTASYSLRHMLLINAAWNPCFFNAAAGGRVLMDYRSSPESPEKRTPLLPQHFSVSRGGQKACVSRPKEAILPNKLRRLVSTCTRMVQIRVATTH